MKGISPFIPAVCAIKFWGQQNLMFVGGLALLNFMGFMYLHRTRVLSG
jgi:hypothetical protein